MNQQLWLWATLGSQSATQMWLNVFSWASCGSEPERGSDELAQSCPERGHLCQSAIDAEGGGDRVGLRGQAILFTVRETKRGWVLGTGEGAQHGPKASFRKGLVSVFTAL